MRYEYKCKHCGDEMEFEQRITDSPLTDCPSCKRSGLQRMISGGSGFVLQGGGWYRDGYGSSTKEK